jgi:arsenate reductase (thioredoxin)
MMLETKPRVLFVCTHNAARSQMAEVLLRHYAGERFEVLSAGHSPTEVHPLTRQALADIGLDSSGLQAKGLDLFFAKVSIAYAIIVCEQVEDDCPRLYPFALNTLYWPFDDPTEAEGSTAGRLLAFRTVRDQIASRVRAWLHELEVST